MNSVNRLILFCLLLLSGFSHANPFESHVELVVGRGEVVMSDDMTIKQAYDQAETLAKIDASKQIGEYFEVLRVADSKSGDIKEVVSSVNATIMKYQVISKSLDSKGDDTIAIVVIETESDSADLELALSRYYDNEQYKAEVEEARLKLVEVETQLVEQKRLVQKIAELESALTSVSSGGGSSVEVERLQGLLAANKKNVSKAVLEFKRITVLKRLDRVVVVDVDSAKETAERIRVANAKAQELYRGKIEALIDAYDIRPQVVVRYDQASGTTNLRTKVYMRLDRYHPAAAAFESEFKTSDMGFSRSRVGVIPPYYFDAMPEHQYLALYMVLDVGGYKHDIPLVLPQRYGESVIHHTSIGPCNAGKPINDLRTKRPFMRNDNSVELQNKAIVCVENGMYDTDTRNYLGQTGYWKEFQNVFDGDASPVVSYSFELRDIQH